MNSSFVIDVGSQDSQVVEVVVSMFNMPVSFKMLDLSITMPLVLDLETRKFVLVNFKSKSVLTNKIYKLV